MSGFIGSIIFTVPVLCAPHAAVLVLNTFIFGEFCNTDYTARAIPTTPSLHAPTTFTSNTCSTLATFQISLARVIFHCSFQAASTAIFPAIISSFIPAIPSSGIKLVTRVITEGKFVFVFFSLFWYIFIFIFYHLFAAFDGFLNTLHPFTLVMFIYSNQCVGLSLFAVLEGYLKQILHWKIKVILSIKAHFVYKA